MTHTINGLWKDEDNDALVHIDAPIFDRDKEDMRLLKGKITIIKGTFGARDRSVLTFRAVLPKLKWRLLVLSSITFEATDAYGHDCFSFTGIESYGSGMWTGVKGKW